MRKRSRTWPSPLFWSEEERGADLSRTLESGRDRDFPEHCGSLYFWEHTWVKDTAFVQKHSEQKEVVGLKVCTWHFRGWAFEAKAEKSSKTAGYSLISLRIKYNTGLDLVQTWSRWFPLKAAEERLFSAANRNRARSELKITTNEEPHVTWTKPGSSPHLVLG